mmetsp:Transcript_99460/g.181415  ORF Transcript_99460/g.181415 Transcript_99460/m.181415 type:complete len:519 (+) Transcript_99460:24-1580(+)
MFCVFFLILCAVARLTSNTDSVQDFTCEALRTVYQINSCGVQDCAAQNRAEGNSVPQPTNQLVIKNTVEYNSGLLQAISFEFYYLYEYIYLKQDKPAENEAMKMFNLASVNQWPNATGPVSDYGIRMLQTQNLKNWALYPLRHAPGTGSRHYYTLDYNLALAAIGVAAKASHIADNGAEYLKKRILDPCETAIWCADGQLAAPKDVKNKLSELMVGRAGSVPNLYSIARDPKKKYENFELYWAQDVPNDGFVLGDVIAYQQKTKTNATIDYLNGCGADGAAGTLQDFASVVKMVLRGGRHKTMNGSLVNVLSPEAIEYALTPFMKPRYPGDETGGLYQTSADTDAFQYSQQLGIGPLNWNGFAPAQDFIRNRLTNGRYAWRGYHGMTYCFDMASKEYSVVSGTQVPGAATRPPFPFGNCELLGKDQIVAQELINSWLGRPGVAAVIGKLDGYEFFVKNGTMRKGEQINNELYYRYGSIGKLLGRLSIAKAVVDDRLIQDSDPISKYIPEFADLKVYEA